MDAANVFARRDLADAELRAFLDESVPLDAVVVGGGFTGLEMAAALSERGLKVTVLEQAAQVLPTLDAEMSSWVEAELKRRGVRVLVSRSLRALHLTEDGQVDAVEVESGERLATDLVLFTLAAQPDAAGTTTRRVFGLDVGRMGLGLPAAREAGCDADCVSVHPKATPIHVLIVYERVSGKLLGAQAVGTQGVDRCIDVLATALHFGATLADLAALDLSSTEDPVHGAALAAQAKAS